MAVRTIKLEKSVFEDNDAAAEKLRGKLKEKGLFLVNVMSSPGAGKTTALISLIRRLSRRYRVGVMEADIDSDVDAVRVAREAGCPSVQLHTGGMCHLDAGMTEQGLAQLGWEFDVVFLENVGNLVCPAEYDTGASMDMMISSVPEGDDKPLKYPLIFEKCGLVLLNKKDALPYFKFDEEAFLRGVALRNPQAVVLPVSAKTGEGMDAAAEYFTTKIEKWRER